MHTNQLPGDKEVKDSFLEELDSIAAATHSEPFRVLGPHWVERDGRPMLAVRAFHPGAREVHVFGPHRPLPYQASRIQPDGLFEALLPAEAPGLIPGQSVHPSAYRLEFTFADGARVQKLDPYAFPPLLSEYDLHLLG